MAFGRANRIDPAATKTEETSVIPFKGAKTVSKDVKREPDADEQFFTIKEEIRGSFVDLLDAKHVAEISEDEARTEISGIILGIISAKGLSVPNHMMDRLIRSFIDDVLGLGPLEPLLAREDITDIMVNGPNNVYIEVGGRIERACVRFKDQEQLINICQRIVAEVGRRVDESSPICDARLLDGSRVNVIVPPLAVDGATLTIRKFQKEKLTLDNLVGFGSITPDAAEILKIIGRVRANVLISGGTGSGKTTLLNCLAAYIDHDQRIVTCEDAAELQLQQPHVVRLETRPPNLEGEGAVEMRDLVKNCLRMRPDRIVVGEVRSGEAFDLLQAMNTGHDGSMGTVHANSPREALSRLETMINGAGFTLPPRIVREMMVSSIDVIVQAERLRDGRRVITRITEVTGMEEDTITTQDLMVFDIEGEDQEGRIIGRHKGTGVGQPAFWDRARYYGEEKHLAEALDRLNRSETM